jgi:hypothetical protein
LPAVQTAGMANKKRKLSPKTVLKLPDLEQSKSAVLNSLTSRSSQRSYDHAIRDFIDWYCSEPRLAFNKTVVTRYRINLNRPNMPLLHDQPAACRHSPTRLRSGRLRAPKSRPCGWNPPGQGRKEARHAHRELVNSRSREAAPCGVRR